MEEDRKVTLWTAQHNIVLETLEEEGVYHVKKEYIEEKYGDVAEIFLAAYNWFAHEMEKRIERPAGAEYPVWLSTDLNRVDVHKNHKLIEVEVKRKNTLIFDEAKWNKILNLSYIPVDDDDRKDHAIELKRYNLNDDSEAYLSEHYPFLKSKIKNSWQRLFDDSIRLSDNNKAALWEIKSDWIKSIKEI